MKTPWIIILRLLARGLLVGAIGGAIMAAILYAGNSAIAWAFS